MNSVLAARLRYLRLSKNLTQDLVAKFIHVNRTTYAGYESGRTEPPVKVLVRIAEFYNVSLDFICGASDFLYGTYAFTILTKGRFNL